LPRAAGLGALFSAVPVVHTALKIAGGVYLLWLAWKVANAGQPQQSENPGTPLTFLQAAAFQWVNPKGWMMALSAISLFVRPQSALADISLVLAIFGFATLVSVVVWTAFGTVVSRALRNERHARIFNIVMAVLLVASIVPMVL
jgi:threonine/homoserine/homoserine lactone efflux protein